MTKKKALLLALSVVFCISLIHCGKSEQSGAAEKKAQKGTTVRFKTVKYIDKQGIGIEAFRFLMPSDWNFEGGIRWVLDNPGMPAVADLRVKNPKGREEFEVFPNQAFFWTNNQMVLSTFPIGSRYFGNEVRPPIQPIEALRNIVIPRFRGNVTELRIISQQPLPELAKALGAGKPQPGVTTSADAAKIRIEYKKNGVPMEEEIYGVVESFSYPLQTMYGVATNIHWVADYLFSFKAEKGKLDANTKTFQTIAYSFRLNPQWFNKYNQVIEYLAQMQIKRIRHIGEISRIISQTHREISDSMLQSYYQRQAVHDKIADNFSQYIRGVDKYYNPIEQKNVELPSGYNNVWTNPSGEYILTDNPNYNPNVGSTRNWQRIEKK